MLVLDLDETLLHVEYKSPPQFDFKVQCDKRILFVQVRPNAKIFLENVQSHYQLAVFTAALPNYADPMLNRMDPERYISFRFYRHHCRMFKDVYVKDLEMLGTPLHRTLLVDNHPGSFMVHRSNGIPIKSYLGGKEDTALLELWSFLDEIKNESNLLPKAVKYSNAWREELRTRSESNDGSLTQSMESTTSSGPQ